MQGDLQLMTFGRLEAIMDSGSVNLAPFKCQIVMCKPMGAGGERYKIHLSDGKSLLKNAMLATQNNKLFSSGDLNGNPIIEVETYQIHNISSKRVFILVNFKILEKRDAMIGNPAVYIDKMPGQASDAFQDLTPQPPTLQQSNGQSSRRVQFRNSPQKKATNNAPAAGCFPITSLTPYQNKWRILAKVLKKFPVREYKNAKGQGKLFSVDLGDNSGEIRATAFNEAAEKWDRELFDGEYYYIAGGNVKPANKQFSSIKNDYELTFSRETVIEKCQQPPSNTVDVHFNFVTFDRLSTLGNQSMIDVIGVVKVAGDLVELTSKAGKPLKKRELTLLDQSLNTVSLTLWGADAEKFEMPSGTAVIVVKGVRVGDFGGVSLSTVNSSSIFLDLNIRETQELMGWYENLNKDNLQGQVRSLTVPRAGGAGTATHLIGVALAQNIGGNSDKREYFNVRGTVKFAKSNDAIYKGCPKPDCKKKLVDLGGGNFRCEKCNMATTEFKHILMLTLQIEDFTGDKWVTLFEEYASLLLGKSSKELGEMKDSNPLEYDQVFMDILFKTFVFRIGAKSETYNDKTDTKWNCFGVTPLDAAAGVAALKELKQKLETMKV